MKPWMPLVLAIVIAGPAWSAELSSHEPADEKAPTLLERLMVVPQRDTFTEPDRKRARIERTLPEMTPAASTKSSWEEFIDILANADLNQANPQQRVMIQKLRDPDFNRLPR